ncbi:ornithine cyclodeaminase family protein [Microlunatus soli]|uniref:Ornithine cyclodeaminase n=1 Tax=Microlunatus soli TaxID=630515 RepID=A0A1H1ZKY8_9ACTN|nr:ornithine cyclodeaminase family protein [Microlunatus soli]SDT34330.1 ornithine cyclodeaminase [Microlunatus soli]
MPLITLDDAATRSLLEPRVLISALREAFADLRDGAFELPQRLALADSGYLVMPTRHSGRESLVVKILSLAAGRDPMISGLVSWSSTATDRSVVAPAETITSLRTGAITGLATDLLAAPDASRLAIFGAGALAADQVRAVHAVRPLSEVTVVVRTPSRADPLMARLRAELPEVDLAVVAIGDRDLSRCDIICCATSSTAPLFAVTELAERVHINAVGSYKPSMHEFPSELITDAASVVVDDLAACMTESGELIDAVRADLIGTDDLTELTTIVGGAPAVSGRTVFKSVGVAIQDWAAMELLAASHS